MLFPVLDRLTQWFNDLTKDVNDLAPEETLSEDKHKAEVQTLAQRT